MKCKKLLVLVASLLTLSACGNVHITNPSSNPSSEVTTSNTTSNTIENTTSDASTTSEAPSTSETLSTSETTSNNPSSNNPSSEDPTTSENTSEEQSSSNIPFAPIEYIIGSEIPSGLKYITNDPAYPDPSIGSAGGVKFRFEGQGLETESFASSSKVTVILNVMSLNPNTKTGTNPDYFTFYGLNPSDEVVATATLSSVEVGENLVELFGQGITKVRVIMTGFPHNGSSYCNAQINGLTLMLEGSSSSTTTSESTSNTTTSENPVTSETPVTSESTSNSSIDQSSETSSSVVEQNQKYTVSITDGTTISSRVSCSEGLTYSSDNTKLYVDIAGALRFGSSKATGEITFNFTNPTKVKTVFVDCEKYSSDGNSELKVTLSNGDTQTVHIDGREEYSFSFAGNTASSSITFSNTNVTKGRVNVYGITISTSGNGGGSSSNTSSTSQSTSNVTSNTQTSNTPTSNVTSNQTTSNNGGTGEYDPSNDSYKGSYYSSIGTNLTGSALVQALGKQLESTHKSKSYGDLWTAYKTTDVRPGTNKIWDMYSNCNYTAGSSQCGNYSGEGNCYNREHTVPQSWFNEASPMKSDVFHVIPTDGYVNGWRSNYPFGEVSSATKTSSNGCKLGPSSVSGISGTVFEPIDEYKGDIARIYFYMCTRSYTKVGSWGGGVFSSSYPYIRSAYFDLYLKWAIEDPVSQKEIDRNNAAYNFQGNRNPYVDCPSLFYRAFIA